ncbi:hypothetical protein KFZ70_06190 [Tamlana fucoidanivorans]|uniref:Uncharacterized protein n=1 Tax=Allotamlana fucoidanivorans TaxID=2583814 RepID=A0A5C4SMS1_9FLAO|nr:hypothetical protein [Tamlana fucoidanivorans]TNJ45397.1 hypothetical protein FGF67_06720 [Tamlana fucoidanivorans]
MKIYHNLESVERDLKILNLERKIALEELKHLKKDYEDSVKLPQWLQTGVELGSKLSTFLFLRKLFKR